MEQALIRLGLNAKEAAIYLFLLSQDSLTAAEIAKKTKQTRTNIYMILESLQQAGVVLTDDSSAVRQYKAADPQILKQLLVIQQQELKQTQQLLAQSFGKMQSMYQLGQLKPGVVYLEGIEGLKTMLDDIARTKEEVVILPSYNAPDNKEAWEVLQRGLMKRKALGVGSRTVFHEGARGTIDPAAFKKRGFDVRFWGERIYDGEFAVYGDKVVFTTFLPTIVNTILTNKVIAQTMRNLFEEVWEKAKP